MNMREALVEAIRECDVVGNVVMENGRMFVDVSIDKIANDLAPKFEGALRAAWAEGYTDGKGLTPHIKPGSDNGVTAGVAAMVEES